jgi:hypothetical protein
MNETPESNPGWNEPPAEPGGASPLPEVEVTEPPHSDKARPAWLRWVAAGAAVLLVVGGFFGAKALSSNSNASASPSTANSGAGLNGGGRGGQPGTFGTIESISGDTLTVKSTATNASVKVVASSSTRVTASTTVGLDSIVTGDRIFVTGAASGTAVTATGITDLGSSAANPPNGGAGANPNRPGGTGGGNGPAANRGGGFTTGTVTSTTPGTIVITAADGTVTTVTTSSSTTVTKNVDSSVGALKVGESVRVVGTTASDGSVTATSISQGNTGGLGGGFGGGAGAGA